MGKEQIISKGKYAYAQPEGMVGVKQYLFVRDEDGKKRLLLRFCNSRQEKCSKFAFILYRLDAKGNVLGTDKLESADREYGEKEVFSFDRRIEVEEKCTDFKVQMVYARYGNYTYGVENNDVSVSYSEKNLAVLGHAKSASKVKPRKIHARTFDMPWIFVVLAMIILALVFAACGFLIKEFKEKEVDFTLSGVSYRFVDKDKKDDVIIMGCLGNYREITLGGEIEGHKVVGIDEDAFEGNDSLVTLKIDGLNVPAGAFEDCESLKTVTINNVTSIGESAFEDCPSLETVTVTEGKKNQLLTIGTGAFKDCKSLKTVEINQILVYGERVDYFSGSENVQTLKLRNFAYSLKDVNSAYVTRLGALFGEDGGNTSSVKLVNLTIENIDSIPKNFVRGFKKLESVKIGSSEITVIGDYAFADCEKLTSLSAKGKLTSIGEYAFSNTDITSIDMSKVKSLGDGAFKKADKLSSVTGFGSGGLDSIPKSTFEGCTSLSTFVMNKNIKHIYSDAFKGAGLTKLTIPQGVSYDAGILKSCKKLAELEVYEFGSAGFVGQLFGADRDDSSTKVASFIPDSLRTVTLGSGTEINADAFKGCANVTTINLPGDIVSIGDNAFSGCAKLSVVDIPADSTTLRTIGVEAFSGCAQLKYVPLLDSLEFIGEGALKGCTSLEAVALPFFGATPALDDADETVSYIFGGSIPASVKELSLLDPTVTALPADAFAGCSGVKTIIIPNNVMFIGERAFSGCTALSRVGLSDGTSGDKLTADLSKVQGINEHAFEGCSALTSVTLGENLSYIGDYAFSKSGLVSLTIPENVDTVGESILSGCNKIGSLTVHYLGASKNDSGRASYYFGSEIPTSLKLIKVVEFKDNIIGAEAFKGCSGVTSFDLPYGIEAVGEEAFRGCTSLTSFDFETVLSVGDRAFYECTALKAVDLSTIGVIGDESFYGCTGLTKAELDGAVVLGEGAFESCTSLSSITLGEGIVSIGSSAFYETAVESVVLPEGLTAIEDYTFSLCASLKSITLPSTLTHIGDNALSGTALTAVKIPEGVTSIGGFAFKDTPLTSLEIPSGVNFIGIYILSGCESIQSLTFPLTDGFLDNRVYSYLFDADFPETLKEITVNGSTYGYIHEGAFAYSYDVEEIIIDAPIEYIEWSAFADCTELRYVSLPESLAYAESDIFDGCYHLYEITAKGYSDVSADNLLQISTERAPTDDVNGYKYARYDGEWYLINYPKGESVSPALPALSTMQSFKIPSYLFYNDDTVKTALFPIAFGVGESAFEGCDALTEVALGDDVEYIGKRAFADCAELENVTFPKALVTIGEAAFINCESLNNVKLYENVISIGNGAFAGCSVLFDVYNASGLNLVAGSKDYGYVARRAVKVHTDMNEESSVEIKIDGKGTFRRSGSAWLLIKGVNEETITLGEFKYEDVRVDSYRIGENAFADCGKIKILVIENAVKQIQSGAFMSCDSLTSLDCSKNTSITELETETFAYCSSLETAILPASVKNIGSYAFDNCYMLQELTMPTALVTIGEGAFSGCIRLISVVLNDKVEKIGYDAFYGCYYLLEVYDLSPYITVTVGSNTNGGVASNAAAVYTSTSLALERREQNGLKFIKGESSWYLYDFDDQGQSVVNIPNLGSGLIIMPYGVMNGSFTGIVMPANVTAIKNNAFRGCGDFDSVYYMGTYDDWNGVEGIYDLSGFQTTYYKEDCVHYNSYYAWTYDANGSVTTKRCEETSEITLAPTCYETGVRTYYCACDGCDYSRTEAEDRLKHQFENDACVHCGETRTVINGDNVQSYVEKGVISMESFEFNAGKNCFASTNKSSYSDSYFVIEADGRMTVSFTVQASSQVNCDFVIVSENGVRGQSFSGRDQSLLEFLLDAGDVLMISYSKDGSGSQNDDCGYIKDLQIVEKQSN